jgi:hypothetical protein
MGSFLIRHRTDSSRFCSFSAYTNCTNPHSIEVNKMLSFRSILLAVAAFATIASAIPTAPPSNDIVNRGGPASDFYFKRGHVNADLLLRSPMDSDAEINARADIPIKRGDDDYDAPGGY